MWSVKENTDWIKRCTMMLVEETTPRRHLIKTWWDGIKQDMKSSGLSWEDKQSWAKWRRKKTKGASG